jgi:Cytotoxic translational repressor of toxin-antitoxin stability system
MASYELAFRRSVAKDLTAIPKRDVARILERIRQLASDPRPPGCEKLSGVDRYRIRQGAWRILYEIEDSSVTVTVVKVAHRREVYRRSD